MKIERRIIDKAKGIIQITTSDERWYLVGEVYHPSVTWIAHYYPKGKGFETWLAKNGMDDAEAVKQAAADKGSKIHHACTDLMKGETVKIDSKYLNNSTGQLEELTADEYSAIMSFKTWSDTNKVKFLKWDFVVVSEEFGYAGTVDFTCKIGSDFWLMDIKSSQAVYPSHEIQVSAYKQTDEEMRGYKLGILQVGYRKNKAGFKFNEIEDKFDLFMSVRQIWKNETEGTKPFQREYPLSLQLNKEA